MARSEAFLRGPGKSISAGMLEYMWSWPALSVKAVRQQWLHSLPSPLIALWPFPRALETSGCTINRDISDPANHRFLRAIAILQSTVSAVHPSTVPVEASYSLSSSPT